MGKILERISNILKGLYKFLGIIIGGFIAVFIGIFTFKLLRSPKDKIITDQEKQNEEVKEKAEEQKKENDEQVDNNDNTISTLIQKQNEIDKTIEDYIKD